MVIFHSYVNVYQRVYIQTFSDSFSWPWRTCDLPIDASHFPLLGLLTSAGTESALKPKSKFPLFSFQDPVSRCQGTSRNIKEHWMHQYLCLEHDPRVLFIGLTHPDAGQAASTTSGRVDGFSIPQHGTWWNMICLSPNNTYSACISYSTHGIPLLGVDPHCIPLWVPYLLLQIRTLSNLLFVLPSLVCAISWIWHSIPPWLSRLLNLQPTRSSGYVG